MKHHSVILLMHLTLISIFGLISVWSTAPQLFSSQLTFFLVAIILGLIVYHVDIKILTSFPWLLYGVSIGVLLITYLFGRDIRGSTRWIDLGLFNLQTSEMIKPILIIFLADYLSRIKKIDYRQFLKFGLLLGIPTLLVFRQPDLGTALSIGSIGLFMLIAVGQVRHIVIAISLALMVFLPLSGYILKPYQQQRLTSFVNPYADPQGSGYNVIQANIAIGSGGFWGKGVRLGTQSQLNYLPERHTDFIFSSFAEEFGLFGAGLLLFLYFSAFYLIIKHLYLLTDPVYFLIGIGVVGLFMFQTLINIGMNLGVMPVTGITLPLFSYGGSSILSFGVLFGLLLRALDQIRRF
jgi:rod shape determining protein RodA